MTPRDVLDRLGFGRRGEDVAARHLAARGYRILGRNLRRRTGEIDLLAEKGELVVFVEVKARRSLRFGAPADAITARKAAALRRAAEGLRLGSLGLGGRPWRIDVVEVRCLPGKADDVRHIESAVELE